MKEPPLLTIILGVVIGNALTASIGEILTVGPNVGYALTFIGIATLFFLVWAIGQSIAQTQKKK